MANTVEKNILIASSAVDEPTYAPVGNILAKHGYAVIVYQTDRVLAGEDVLVVDLDSEGRLAVTYNGTSLLPDNLNAAWMRKIGSFALPYAEPQVAKQLYINNEVRHVHDTIWHLYPEYLWLSAPDNLTNADHKLGQLLTAHEVGFSIPQTVISSDWSEVIQKLLPTGDMRMIIKVLRGVISDNNQLKAMYTHLTDRDEAIRLSTTTYAFPALYQPFIQKAREWRITAVGQDVFPVAIYTDYAAKDDWRRLQTTSSVQFRTEKLPDGVDDKCIAYLGKMSLGFGAFDFIETPEGEIVFLECNPNGQYGWLEESLGLPISAAIASELMKIAQR